MGFRPNKANFRNKNDSVLCKGDSSPLTKQKSLVNISTPGRGKIAFSARCSENGSGLSGQCNLSLDKIFNKIL